MKFQFPIKWILLFSLTFLIFNLSLAAGGIEEKLNTKSNYFIKNKGQLHDQHGKQRDDIQFYRSFRQYNAYLNKNTLSFQLQRFSGASSEEIKFYRVDMDFINVNSHSIFKGEELQESFSNYYNGNSEEGHLNVQHFAAVKQHDIYEGIDLRYYDQEGHLEYDFIVSPYTSAEQIAMKIKGYDSIHIGSKGELIIKTAFGDIVQKKPIAFQDDVEIDVSWKISGSTVFFNLGDYDRSKTLVIDPVVQVWGTFFGGSSAENAYSVEVDGQKVYICGSTLSTSNIATTGAHQSSFSAGTGTDAFLACFDLNGNLNWATYYGGSGADFANDCQVDKNHNIYIIGATRSSSGIATSGTHQDTYSGGLDDIFIVKFDPSGIRIWGTYFGRPDRDYGTAIALDSSMNIYMTGRSRSDSMSTIGAYQTLNAGDYDILLAKFDSTGNLQWSTYHGALNADNSYDIKLDDSLDIYLVGSTSSNGLATPSVHQQNLQGISDALLTKFSNSGNLLWCTYFGGLGQEIGNAFDINSKGEAVMVGYAGSTSDIASPGAFQDTLNGLQDNFIAKFNSSGSRIWSTYYGGNNAEQGICVVTDASDNIFLGGMTNSTSLFATAGVHQDTLGGSIDATLIKFNDAGNLVWATYYGASGNGYNNGITLDEFGQVYLTGSTSGSIGYATSGTHQSSNNGLNEAFLSKFYDCSNGSYLQLSACDSVQKPNSQFWWTSSTTDRDTFINSASCDSIVIYEVSVWPSNIQQVKDSTCDIYISPLGKVYSSSGIYYDTLVNALGCDSIIETDLYVNVIDTSISASQTDVMANAVGKTYQWLDCQSNYASISGATAQTFTPLQNGSYAVQITDGECVDTSSCFEFKHLSVLPIKGENGFQFHPNPSNGILTINFENEFSGQISLINGLGSVVYFLEVQKQTVISINIPDQLINGLYFIQLQSGNEISRDMFILNK